MGAEHESPPERSGKSRVLEDFVAAREAMGVGPPVTVPSQADEQREPWFFLALSGILGLVMAIGGGGLAVIAFDKTFLVSDSSAWDLARGVGTVLFLVGALLVAISLVGGLLVAARRVARRARATTR